MAALGSDIFAVKDLFLGQLRIEIGLGHGVGQVLRPAHEVVHATLRTVGIINLQAIAVTLQVIAGSPQAVGRHTRHQCHGLLISVNPRPHKVVGTVITYLKDRVGHHIGNAHKTAPIHRLVLHLGHVLGALATGKQACRHEQGCSNHLCVSHWVIHFN